MVFEKLGLYYRLVRYALPVARMTPQSPQTMADLIEDQVASRGESPFILFEDRSVSYLKFNAMANRVAHWGLSIGLGRGDVVALLMLNRPEYLAVWGGLSKIGVTTALLNTNLVGPQLAHAIDAASTRRLILGSECIEGWSSLGADDVPGLETFVWADTSRETADVPVPPGAIEMDSALAAQSDINPDVKHREGVTAGDTHVFIYTSGTTGLPKAAKMSHLRFGATGLGPIIYGFGKKDVMYCALPLYHSAGGAMATVAALRAGGVLAIRRKFSASQFWSDIVRYEATCFQYIGEFCRYLLHQESSPAEQQHKLRFCIGNGLRPDIWEQFQSRFAIPRILEFYGATEGNVALLNLDNKVGAVGKRPPALIPPPILARYDIEADDHIRGDDGLCIECAPDEVGELLGEIPKDPGVTQGRFEGYTSKEATEKKILRDVKQRGDTWFRTGDLLRCDEEGYFYFVDRIGDTFRWKGENVSTQEVAEALSVDSSIELCNVYGVEVEGEDGRAGMASIVLSDGADFNGKAIYDIAENSLPSYARPVFVRLQPKPEMTGTFKLRKVDLQREGWDPATVSDPIYLRDDESRSYVELTAERLGAIRAGEIRI
jgi:fatty-acyl-CoA synthase